MFKLLAVVSLAILSQRVAAVPVWGQCMWQRSILANGINHAPSQHRWRYRTYWRCKHYCFSPRLVLIELYLFRPPVSEGLHLPTYEWYTDNILVVGDPGNRCVYVNDWYSQ